MEIIMFTVIYYYNSAFFKNYFQAEDTFTWDFKCLKIESSLFLIKADLGVIFVAVRNAVVILLAHAVSTDMKEGQLPSWRRIQKGF